MVTTQTESQSITLEDVTNNLYRLTSPQAEGVALLLNSKVPANDAISSEVSDIVGLTKDGQVFYAGAGNPPTYWIEPFEAVYAHLQKSIEEGRASANEQKERPMFKDSSQWNPVEAHRMDGMASRGIYEALTHEEELLRKLESLRPAYETALQGIQQAK